MAKKNLENIIDEIYEFAVIGGTGFADFLPKRYEDVETDFGTIRVYELKLGGKKVAYVTRHVNKEVPDILRMKAYIQALRVKNVKTIFGISAAGRISEDVSPGNIVLLEEFKAEGLSGRIDTFTESGLIEHTFEPYFTPRVREEIKKNFDKALPRIRNLYGKSGLEAKFHENGFATNINGPRYATRAEEDEYRINRAWANFYRQSKLPDGIKELPKTIDELMKHSHDHVIMMTAREGFLAREYGMEYVNIVHCTDYSSSPPIGGSKVNAKLVGDVSHTTGKAVRMLLYNVLKNWNPNQERNIVPLWDQEFIDVPYLASDRDRDGNAKRPLKILARHISDYLSKPKDS